MAIERVEDLDRLDFARGGGVVTVVAQDARTRQVLMVANADREALELSIRTGEMHYRSRTRGRWHKGGTSGNVLRVRALISDCDADAVLALVDPAGPACHTGAVSCFNVAEDTFSLFTLDATLVARAEAPAAESYTRRLLDDRNLRLKKLGEECAELVTACADGNRERAVSEAADLLYHVLVAVRATGGALSDVVHHLGQRHRRSSG
jgi:phosphoribosyl-ATP pyrophosphohydrolase/phosphoribosyl-AMP cyclohydrolase